MKSRLTLTTTSQLMKIKLVIPAILFSITCAAQQFQTRAVEPFNKIQLSGSVDVLYTASDTLALSVKVKNGNIDNVETKVVNSTLMISNRSKLRESVTVYIKNSQLVYVESDGATDFETTNMVKGDSITFNVSGAVYVNASLGMKKIKVLQSGASDLKLSGNTDHLFLNIAGAASFKGYDMASKEAIVLSSGAAVAKINASERVRINASGASDVKVKGAATDVSADVTASADVARIEEQGKNNTDSDNDSTFYHFRHKQIIIVRKSDHEKRAKNNGYEANDFKHWTGFSAGINGYMSSGSANLPGRYGYMNLDYRRSFNLQLNVFEHQFNIINNKFKIITGLGLDFHLYELAGKTTLNPDSSFTAGAVDSTSSVTYKKNKLRNTYVQVPLLFEFNTSNDPTKTFHIAVGVIGQFLIASRTKQVLEEDNYTITKIRKDNYNMNPFAAKAHVNMGYRGWTIYAEYNLTPLFQQGKGPELYTFTVGLRVIPFA